MGEIDIIDDLQAKYSNDLAVRFSYTDIPKDKIKIYADIGEAYRYLDGSREEYIYVITCFSDKNKFFWLKLFSKLL